MKDTEFQTSKDEWKRIGIAILFVLVTAGDFGCRTGEEAHMTIQLRSSAFENGAMLPAKFTCDGENISPPLEWSIAPLGVKSFVVISDDPDAPVGTWVHWVLFNIPASVTAFPEKIPPTPVLPDGSVHGMTDFRQLGYGGPCPPSGTHRYFFKIYALDTKLDLKPGATKRDVEKAMQGHILAQGELIGKYKRSR